MITTKLYASNGNNLLIDNQGEIAYLKSNANDTDVYDLEYWNNYRKLQNTLIAKELNKHRMILVDTAINLLSLNKKDQTIVDVGIGSGEFTKNYDCKGYDVNAYAVSWLKNNDRYVDVYECDDNSIDIMTLWDVIEHIDNPTKLLNKVSKLVVLSTPIYDNVAHIISSKHFKPNEHIWYFTDAGIRKYMHQYGFKCILSNDWETQCGRESIGSYIFKRG